MRTSMTALAPKAFSGESQRATILHVAVPLAIVPDISKPDWPVVVDPVPATTSAQFPMLVWAGLPADWTLYTINGSS